jgi:hypothetical protein
MDRVLDRGHSKSLGGNLPSMSDATVRLTRQGLMSALRSKWWVLPITVAICTGLLFAQASDFDSEPARVETTRRLEGKEVLSSLIALEIDAQAFAPLLSIGAEIARFNSDEAQELRNSRNNLAVKLLVSQVPGDYNVINREVTDRNTIYSYVSVGTGIYVFTCTESTEKDCERALDVGVAEFELSRSATIQSSIDLVADALEARLGAVRELISTTNETTALLAQQQLEIELASQVAVLRSSSTNAAFELSLIDEVVQPRAATVNTVTTSTYLLGLILGGLIGGLIILQFAALRSRRP